MNIDIIDQIIQYNATGNYLIRLKKKDYKHRAALSTSYIFGSYKSMIKFHIANNEERISLLIFS